MTRPTTDSCAPRFDGFDRPHRGLVGALDQQAVLLGDVAGQERGVGVAVHAVDVGRDVDVDDVAVFDHGRVGDAVADDLVQRRAARFGIALVAQRRRVGAVVDHVVVGDWMPARRSSRRARRPCPPRRARWRRSARRPASSRSPRASAPRARCPPAPSACRRIPGGRSTWAPEGSGRPRRRTGRNEQACCQGIG